ncbi:MAG: hypothetical protein FWH47_01355 [Methanomassiliicoccaceae archaeon]|nr:hypothetical protein [Methanomassiliicoccaceae archaeon]
MSIFNLRPEPVASLEYKKEDKGKTTTVGIIEFESDAGEMVVKIVTRDNFAGIDAEYAFINYKFPGYMVTMQSLMKATINDKHVMCDRLTIRNEDDERQVYFDISDFL